MYRYVRRKTRDLLFSGEGEASSHAEPAFTYTEISCRDTGGNVPEEAATDIAFCRLGLIA